MIDYMRFSPYVCIGVLVVVLIVLCAFAAGKKYQFVGLAPLNPETCAGYTGSPYSWGNEIVDNPDVCIVHQVDNTPAAPVEFLEQNETICIKPDIKVQPEIKICNKKSGRFVSKGEKLCCEIMERIYGVPFKSVRPAWLSNPETGYNLELDCYNDELKIAVEYNGEQHYKWPNFTNQTYEQFINQVRRDKYKVETCDSNGVYLITVPYNIAHNKIASYITSYLPETIRDRLREESTLQDMELC
jgi:hypothetical protein